MSRAAQLESAKRIAKWKADQYLGLGVEDLDWLAIEILRINEDIAMLIKRRDELEAKQVQLQNKTHKALTDIVAKAIASSPKPKGFIRRV